MNIYSVGLIRRTCLPPPRAAPIAVAAHIGLGAYIIQMLTGHEGNSI